MCQSRQAVRPRVMELNRWYNIPATGFEYRGAHLGASLSILAWHPSSIPSCHNTFCLNPFWRAPHARTHHSSTCCPVLRLELQFENGATLACRVCGRPTRRLKPAPYNRNCFAQQQTGQGRVTPQAETFGAHRLDSSTTVSSVNAASMISSAHRRHSDAMVVALMQALR
jgi:hypothetical protein